MFGNALLLNKMKKTVMQRAELAAAGVKDALDLIPFDLAFGKSMRITKKNKMISI